MIVNLIIEIYPKNEVLNPETEAVKKSLVNLGYDNIKQLIQECEAIGVNLRIITDKNKNELQVLQDIETDDNKKDVPVKKKN